MHIRLILQNGELYVICGYEDGSVASWDISTCTVIDTRKLFDNPGKGIALVFNSFSYIVLVIIISVIYRLCFTS